MASRGCERHRSGDENLDAYLSERVAAQTSPVPVPATPHKHSRPARVGSPHAEARESGCSCCEAQSSSMRTGGSPL